MRYPSVAIALLLAACTPITGPTNRTIVSVIDTRSVDGPAIEVPAEVAAGESFTVSIGTFWHNGCARMGETKVRQDGPSAVITPHEVISEGGLCTQAPVYFTHTASVRFTSPGTATVVIRGRLTRDGPIMEFERQVTVK